MLGGILVKSFPLNFFRQIVKFIMAIPTQKNQIFFVVSIISIIECVFWNYMMAVRYLTEVFCCVTAILTSIIISTACLISGRLPIFSSIIMLPVTSFIVRVIFSNHRLLSEATKTFHIAEEMFLTQPLRPVFVFFSAPITRDREFTTLITVVFLWW